MRILKVLLVAFLVVALTITTQVGGAVLLLSLLLHPIVVRSVKITLPEWISKGLTFVTLYLLFTFLIIPYIAAPLGRVPLPVWEGQHLKPANMAFCLLNRHYVRPQLKSATLRAAEEMANMYPGTVTNYLDAGFPFIDGFPLLPHLSHSDGKKLDLSFQYNDAKTGEPTREVPSFIGYGICEGPKEGEINMAEQCSNKGYWQYGLMEKAVSQENKHRFTFHAGRTKVLVQYFIRQDVIGKVFIEPHLKSRLGLSSNKIRFHGCQAVRHDDHIHVQMK
ncbi:MAG: hypothetical protein OEX02_15745 [Cyclobacteriaceae bacterium]|nr:hypothetical protein [Cyclobacteriaceae bacterium]